eukprot:5557906-Pyramimonas_sp.AAC.1
MQPQEMKLRLQRATDAAVLRGDVAVMIEAQTYDLQERIQHLQGRLQAVKDASDVGRLRAEALATMEEGGAQALAVRAAIQGGAEVNHGDGTHDTPLQRAMGAGRAFFVRMLSEAGADVNKACEHDENGAMTPLYMAAYLGDVVVTRALLEAGAD